MLSGARPAPLCPSVDVPRATGPPPPFPQRLTQGLAHRPCHGHLGPLGPRAGCRGAQGQGDGCTSREAVAPGDTAEQRGSPRVTGSWVGRGVGLSPPAGPGQAESRPRAGPQHAPAPGRAALAGWCWCCAVGGGRPAVPSTCHQEAHGPRMGARLGAAGLRQAPEQRAFEQHARLLRALRPADLPGNAEAGPLCGLSGPTWSWNSWPWSPPTGLCAGDPSPPMGTPGQGQAARTSSRDLTLLACAPGPDGWRGLAPKSTPPPGSPVCLVKSCLPQKAQASFSPGSLRGTRSSRSGSPRPHLRVAHIRHPQGRLGGCRAFCPRPQFLLSVGPHPSTPQSSALNSRQLTFQLSLKLIFHYEDNRAVTSEHQGDDGKDP